MLRPLKTLFKKLHITFLWNIFVSLFIGYYRWRLAPVPEFWKKLIRKKEDTISCENYVTENRKNFYRLVRKNISISPKSRILDIGCSYGYFFRILKENNEIREPFFVGLEYNVNSIMNAKHHDINASFLCGDIFNLPVKKGRFNYIFMMEILEHLENPLLAIKNAYELLRNNGELIITVPYGRKDFCYDHINFWTEKSFKNLLKPFPNSSVKLINDRYTIIAKIHKKQIESNPKDCIHSVNPSCQ